MKCKSCKSCLRLIRLDFEIQSYVYWYCPLENKAWAFGKLTAITDSNIMKKIEESYKELYGNTVL